jgi:hypothetical protein
MKTCSTCGDTSCPDYGRDANACDEWTSEIDEDGIPLEADPTQERVLDEMDHRLRALERELSELRAALGRWVGQVEGGDYD